MRVILLGWILTACCILPGCKWGSSARATSGAPQAAGTSPAPGVLSQKERSFCANIGFATPGARYQLSEDPGESVIPRQGIPGREMGVGTITSYWEPGEKLDVCFTADSKGDEALKARIMSFAQEWTAYARLSLARTESCDEADIRVFVGDGTQEDKEDWSYVGTASRTATGPSMQLGAAARPGLREWELRRSVLHEFGHALGMEHEHLNPTVRIPWNRTAVIAYYRAKFNWTDADVERNFFREIDSDPLKTDLTAYDEDSVMHYDVPNEFTIGTFHVAASSYISNGDKLWAAIAYPREGMSREKSRELYNAAVKRFATQPQFHSFQVDQFPPDETFWQPVPLRDDETFESAHDYANDSRLEKSFDLSRLPATFVRARFERVDLEKSYDFLDFSIPHQNGKTVLARFSGEGLPYVSPALPARAFSIRFSADESTTRWGFRLAGWDMTTKVIQLMGCMDAAARNYSEDARLDDGSCIAKVSGCTNRLAENFNPQADEDDGSCFFSPQQSAACSEARLTLTVGAALMTFDLASPEACSDVATYLNSVPGGWLPTQSP